MRKDRKIRKSRSERKWWVLAKPPYFPQGNGRQSPMMESWNRGIDHRMRRKIKGADVVKVWEVKQDRGCIPDTFT